MDGTVAHGWNRNRALRYKGSDAWSTELLRSPNTLTPWTNPRSDAVWKILGGQALSGSTTSTG